MKRYIKPILIVEVIEDNLMVVLSGDKTEGDNDNIIHNGGSTSENPGIDPDGAKRGFSYFDDDDEDW